MAYVLIWAVVILTSSGIKTGNVQDSTAFKSETECVQFAEAHKTRMEDWVRGGTGSGWDAPVQVEFTCTPSGQPA